jgi:hypothetical protein
MDYLFSDLSFYAKFVSSHPTIKPYMIVGVIYFWFMMGKSSGVYSRTHGSVPILFCRWIDVLRVLH